MSERLRIWFEEARYTLSSRWRLAQAAHRWLCSRGLHVMEWDPYAGRSWSEPGEPGWECRHCVEPGFPVRVRAVIWMWEHAPMRWYAEWRIDRDWQRYLRDGEP